MTKKDLDILQQLVPFIQRIETTLFIARKEGINLSDISMPDNFEKNLQTALNDIKALDKKVMAMMKESFIENESR